MGGLIDTDLYYTTSVIITYIWKSSVRMYDDEIHHYSKIININNTIIN